MAISRIPLIVVALLIPLKLDLVHATFSRDTSCTWGYDNCKISWNSLSLSLNQWSGAAIQGNKEFLFGYIDMQIKLVPGDSAGVVTTYYISSPWSSDETDTHDEIDFEFLGNVSGQPYTIHTNIFVHGDGQKEQQFKPWFDPTLAYHSYRIFWNPYMTVWSVDDTVIRVYKNYESKGLSLSYPDQQPMRVFSSIWNADGWATQGGRVKTNWTYAPFTANYIYYRDDVCEINEGNNVDSCSMKNHKNWYTNYRYAALNRNQINDLEYIRKNYMIYDYCSDVTRFNGNMPSECSLPPY